VPGWHEATKEHRESGRIRMVGIIQEQHPERAELFMQWKGMDWPILVDSLNLLGVTAVPTTLLIDEYGVIRAVQPDEAAFLEFLRADYPPPGQPWDPSAGRSSRTELNREEKLRNEAGRLFLSGDNVRLDDVIEAYAAALEAESSHGPTQFRLGVAYRARYDSDGRRPGDFESAVAHWTKALEIDPNQYVWRRRIQQYGPRLDKPYSFYDWVHQAREEIAARGGVPFSLAVEPSGAEFAHPEDRIQPTESQGEPDPGGRIHGDREQMIRVETAMVPGTADAGSLRVHIVFRPDPERKVHWNNEVEGLRFWVDAPRGWTVDNPFQILPTPPQPVSREDRRVEFELKREAGATESADTASGYALYYICDDVNGACLYRRQDVRFHLPPKR
jgi:tetratricopeptide (TPR) repeat protein